MKFLCFLIAMTAAATSACAADITAMISQYRREHGLPAVKTDPKLMAIAEKQAQAMAASGIMTHNVAGPFASRIVGAHLATGGENIAAGSKTWAETLQMWKKSPGHNKNLLLPSADILGIAVARNENTRYKVYWAMVIGRHDTKHRPEKTGTVTAARETDTESRAGAADPAPVASSVTEWVNQAITSMKNLLP